MDAVEDGKQAVNAVLTLDPDALVIDISMPVLNGLQAAKQLQTANCRTRIIFLSIYDGRDFLDASFSAGASGYVNKCRLSTDLIPAIHRSDVGTNLGNRAATDATWHASLIVMFVHTKHERILDCSCLELFSMAEGGYELYTESPGVEHGKSELSGPHSGPGLPRGFPMLPRCRARQGLWFYGLKWSGRFGRVARFWLRCCCCCRGGSGQY